MPMYYNNSKNQSLQIRAEASNIRLGSNQIYTYEQFLEAYPQFTDPTVPEAMVQMFIDLANATIAQSRWNAYWKLGISLFVAHFCTLYLMSSVPTGADSDLIVSNALQRGILASESAGDVSASYDNSFMANDLMGWGAFKQTQFGVQFATFAKMVSMGGMVV